MTERDFYKLKTDKLEKLYIKEQQAQFGLDPKDQWHKNILAKAVAVEWAHNLVREGLDR